MSQKARQELWRMVQEMPERTGALEEWDETLKKENRKLHEESQEYRHRHPETADVDNGKAHVITQTARKERGNELGRKPGSQPGHQPHFR